MNTGDDFDGGASMRSRNSQYELSSSLFAQIPADILVNNHINATQLQSSHGSRTVAATKGVGDETEGVLDAASSPRRQERETSREYAAQKQALVNAIARGAQDFQANLRELLQKALWRDQELDEKWSDKHRFHKTNELGEDELEDE